MFAKYLKNFSSTRKIIKIIKKTLPVKFTKENK